MRTESARAKLLRLRSALAQLRPLVERGLDVLRADPTLQWAVERGTQVAAEGVFDLGNHILAQQYAQHPEHYRDVAPMLARHGVITTQLAGRLEGLAGLRNLLVHEYSTVDHERLHASLRDGLADLEAFAAELTAWLDRQESA